MKQVIESRNKKIIIEAFTGKLVEYAKDREIKVYGSGGGSSGNGYNNPVRISSTTIIHDNLFLINKEGEERDFQFQNYDISARKDHIITILYCYEEGMENMKQIFAVINNTLKKKIVDRNIVRHVSYWGNDNNGSKIRGYTVLGLIAIGIFLCFKWLILGLAVFGFIAYKAYESYKLANEFEKKILWPNVELW